MTHLIAVALKELEQKRRLEELNLQEIKRKHYEGLDSVEKSNFIMKKEKENV